MKVDAFCSQPHYLEHLAPVWFELSGEVRGRFYVAGLLADSHNGEGIPGWTVGYPPPGPGLLTLVAGAPDELAIARPVIYLEHGAGQTYRGDPDPAVRDHPGYSGSPGHDRVRLFLCPGRAVVDRWRARYPHTPAVAVGCPRLDHWHRRPAKPAGAPPTLAVTFHANNVLTLETRPAWKHYEDGLPEAVRELREAGWQIIGHGHPKLWRPLAAYWQAIGVEAVQSIDEVFARADVLAADNTSAAPEFATLGRPIIWLNAPWYRRDVDHGGRFWDWAGAAVSVDGPEGLPEAARWALLDDPVIRRGREQMVRDVYVGCDGGAAARAVAAILSLDETRV